LVASPYHIVELEILGVGEWWKIQLFWGVVVGFINDTRIPAATHHGQTANAPKSYTRRHVVVK
jgi:hypothetical protein